MTAFVAPPVNGLPFSERPPTGDPIIRTPGLVSLSPFPGPIYPPTWRGRYPHLMPVDVAIWNRFMDKYSQFYLGFQYDIVLGQGADPIPGMSTEDRFILWSLTVKRCDCLCIQRAGLTLVEVKPRLGMAAMGQMLSYQKLWLLQYGSLPAIRVMTVCEQSEPDLARVCSEMGFYVVVV